MADPTYQTGVYRKQGGDEYVVASGGEFTVESSGTVTIESGGKLDLQSGAEFQFYNTDFAASKLENLILSLTTTSIIDSTAYSLGVTSVLSVPYGNIVMSFATGCTSNKVYFKLPAPQSGRILKFFGSQMGANAVITISDNSAAVAGAGLTTYITTALSVALSSIQLSLGAVLELRYVSDTTWAVVTGNATTNESAAA